MRAIIMAGGQGKRLRPLTCTRPKPMAPILDKPLIGYCVALLKKHGVTDITATLQYMPEQIMTYLQDGADFGVTIRYAVEERPLGTAGSVRNALGETLERTLVISGDALTDVDLTEALRFHEAHRGGVTLLLSRVDTPTEYGVVLLEKDGRVLRFLEKPGPSEVFSDFANTGIYILEPDILSRIPENGVFDFGNDLFPLLMREDIPIYGYVAAGYWCDVGSLAAYGQAQMDMLDGKCTLAPHSPDGIWIAEGAHISPDAVLLPPCYIGAEAEIGPRTAIGPYTVVGRGSRIGAGSSLRRSMLLPDVRVRENVQVRGAVLCEQVHVERGASVFDGAVVGAETRVEREASIKPRVLIWPARRLGAGRTFAENVIWEAPQEGAPTTGYGDADMTPSHAARIGAAFANVCARQLPVTLCVGTDGSQQAVMLKGAACSGMLSQGADVYDLGCLSRGGFAFGVRELACAGGVYIEKGELAHMASMLLHDETGAQLSTAALRKFTQAMGEERRALTARRLGILAQADVTRAFEAYLMRAAGNMDGLVGSTLVLSAPEVSFDAVARVLTGAGMRVLLSDAGSTEKLAADMRCAGATAGAALDSDGIAAFLCTRETDPRTRTAALMLDLLQTGGGQDFVLPVDVPEEYAQYLREQGAKLKRVSRDPAAWEREAHAAGCYYPTLFLPEAGLIRLTALAARGELETLLGAIPAVYEKSESIRCSWRDMGRVLRTLVESENTSHLELLDGVRVREDDGWVLVRPETSGACRVLAGSMRAEYAEELCDLYARKVKAALDKRED